MKMKRQRNTITEKHYYEIIEAKKDIITGVITATLIEIPINTLKETTEEVRQALVETPSWYVQVINGKAEVEFNFNQVFIREEEVPLKSK